jgi:hypothetical protein
VSKRSKPAQWALSIGAAVVLVGGVVGAVEAMPSYMGSGSGPDDPGVSAQPSADTTSWAYKQGQTIGDAVARQYGFVATPNGKAPDCDPKKEAYDFVSSTTDVANFNAGFVMACTAAARVNAGMPPFPTKAQPDPR